MEAVFDTGATKGSIDRDYLKNLVKDPTTENAVIKLEEIEPIPCQGMAREGPHGNPQRCLQARARTRAHSRTRAERGYRSPKTHQASTAGRSHA